MSGKFCTPHRKLAVGFCFCPEMRDDQGDILLCSDCLAKRNVVDHQGTPGHVYFPVEKLELYIQLGKPALLERKSQHDKVDALLAQIDAQSAQRFGSLQDTVKQLAEKLSKFIDMQQTSLTKLLQEARGELETFYSISDPKLSGRFETIKRMSEFRNAGTELVDAHYRNKDLNDQLKIVDAATNMSEKVQQDTLIALLKTIEDESKKRGDQLGLNVPREEGKVPEEEQKAYVPIMPSDLVVVGDDRMRLLPLSNLQEGQERTLSEATGCTEKTAYTFITNTKVFCCGSSLPNMKLSFIVDLQTMMVEKHHDMLQDRGFPGLIYHEETDSAYVFGGFGQTFGGLTRSLKKEKTKPFVTAEMTTFSTGTWTGLPDMPHPRYAFNPCLGGSGDIYLVGGWNSDGAVDVFYPTTQTYINLPMKVSAYFISAVVQNGQLLVFAGGKMDVWSLGSNEQAPSQPYAALDECWSNLTPITIQQDSGFVIYLLNASTARALRINHPNEGSVTVEETRFNRPFNNPR